MRVSIVIRSYNEAKHIGKLLLGIAEQTLAASEVIVVDSGSTDGTPEIARALGARVISIDKREFTFGRALNIGCRAATGDVLVFASAHVYPTHRTWLHKLTAPFADPRVVLSYGKQRGNAVNKYSEHQIFERWFPNQSALPQRSYFCNNANCAVRRSAWEQIPYDETLTGLEDLAWAKLAQARGGWLAYVADAGIIHVHDENWASVRNRYRREAMAMKRIDEHVRFSRMDMVGLFFSNTVVDLSRAAREHLFLKEFKSIVAFRWNQFAGTFEGHNGPEEVSEELKRRFYFPNIAPDRQVAGEPDHQLVDYAALEDKLAEGLACGEHGKPHLAAAT